MDGTRLVHSLTAPSSRRIQFDYSRHRRVMNLEKNLVRLNEFPEWSTVDENHLYRLRSATSQVDEVVRHGSELIAGVELAAGDWIVEPLGEPPYAGKR